MNHDGFGRGAASGDGFTWASKSRPSTIVPRIHLRAPQELNAIEMDIRKRVKARLSRGRVDLNISFDRTGSEATYQVNQSIVSAYVDALRDIQRQFNLSGDIDVTSIARLPGALSSPRDELNEGIAASVDSAIDQALDSLEQSGAPRVRPG